MAQFLLNPLSLSNISRFSRRQVRNKPVRKWITNVSSTSKDPYSVVFKADV